MRIYASIFSADGVLTDRRFDFEGVTLVTVETREGGCGGIFKSHVDQFVAESCDSSSGSSSDCLEGFYFRRAAFGELCEL